MSQKNGANAPSLHFEELGLSWRSYPKFLNLSKNQRMAITNSLVGLTGLGFNKPVSEQLTDDVSNHVSEAERLFVLDDKSGKPQAYISAATSLWNDYLVYELWGIIIKPEFQRKGLGFSMLMPELCDVKPELIILRTQSTSMYKLSAKVSYLSEELTRDMAPEYYPDNLDGLINRGVYPNGESLYGDSAAFKDQAIPFIDWEKGDGLVIAGFIRKELVY